MKQTGLAAIVAVSLGCTAAIAQSANPTQQGTTPTRTGAASTITVVGCVQPDEGGAAEAPATPGITASRANTTYVLTNVIPGNGLPGNVRPGAAAAGQGGVAGQTTARGGQADAATAQPSAPQGATDPRGTAHRSARITLEGHDMTPYAAQQVEVTGTMADAPATRSAQNGSARGTPAEVDGQWIRVTNVRRIATSCPPQP